MYPNDKGRFGITEKTIGEIALKGTRFSAKMKSSNSSPLREYLYYICVAGVILLRSGKASRKQFLKELCPIPNLIYTIQTKSYRSILFL